MHVHKAEKLKAGVRAKVEHPFRVIKRQFGFVKVRYHGLKKSTQQLFTLFALSNLWMVRAKLMQMQASVRVKTGGVPVKTGENSLNWAEKGRNLAGFLGNSTI